MPAQLLALRCEETLSGTIQIFSHRVIAGCNDNRRVSSNRCSHVHTYCCCSCCCPAVSVPGSSQRPEAYWVRTKSIGSNGRRVPAGGAGGCALLILAAAAAAAFAAWPTLPVVLPPHAWPVSRAMYSMHSVYVILDPLQAGRCAGSHHRLSTPQRHLPLPGRGPAARPPICVRGRHPAPRAAPQGRADRRAQPVVGHRTHLPSASPVLRQTM